MPQAKIYFGIQTGGGGGGANTNLDNLVIGNTSIPSGTNLNSVTTGEFFVSTSPQVAANSGAIRLTSGNVSGLAVSGAARIRSGDNTAANTGTFPATGLVSVVSGAVSGTSGVSGLATFGTGQINAGVTGDSGLAQLLTGNISTGATGNSGLINVTSGNILGAGRSGDAIFRSGSVAVGGQGNSGDIGMFSGNILDGNGTSGVVGFRSGFVQSALGGNAGDVFVYTGKSFIGNSGNLELNTGPVNSDTLGGFSYNNVNGTGATGFIRQQTGEIANPLSSANTGEMILRTGNNAGSGNSGDISISTGSATTGLNRGILTLNARHIDVSSNQIKDLADPTDPQDAVTKAYADGITDSAYERIQLTLTDITNQFLDLANAYQLGTVLVFKDRLARNVNEAANADYDFIANNANPTTRLVFQGPSATGGADELLVGDVLFVKGFLL